MRISKLFPIFLALIVALPGVLDAQSAEAANAGKAYKVLQTIVVGSSGSEAGEELSPAVRTALDEMRPELAYGSYSRVASLYGPLGIGGEAQWKLITRNLGSFGSEYLPIIAEWRLGVLEPVPGNDALVEFRRFLFMARVPAKIGESVNYESIQLTLNRVRVPVGKASVIGNLPVPETGEMLFFVVNIDEIR